MKHLLLIWSLLLTSSYVFAQQPAQPGAQTGTALDPTGKRFVKPRERTPYGGPSHLTHTLPAGEDNVNITFIEIQLDPSEKGGYDVTARGTKTPKVRGCDNCTVAGRILINGKASKEFESVALNDTSTKAKLMKNAASCKRVAFQGSDKNEYAAVTNPEGGFMLSTLPNGTYSIWVGGKKVIDGFVLKEIPLTPEQLKKEQEMREKREIELKQKTMPVSPQKDAK